MTHAIATNNYGVAKIIVSPSPANGTHTTISSAMNSATSGDMIAIRPGTYVEDVSLKAGVSMTALGIDNTATGVVISGTVTASYNGEASITGIRLQTNGAPALSITGSNASSLNLFNCDIRAVNAAGISANNSSFGLSLYSGIIGASASQKMFDITAIGGVSFRQVLVGNADSTAGTIASGAINIYNSDINGVMATSGTASINVFNSRLAGSNSTVITTAGTGSSTIYNSFITSGTASAISIGSGTTVGVYNSNIDSTNANAVTGAGTFNHSGISYSSTSTINPTTINNLSFGRTGTWTPGVSFGAATTGITYGSQSGVYAVIGNVVFISGKFTLTNKGTATGSALLTGLPVTGTGAPFSIAVNTTSVLTTTANFTELSLVDNGTTNTAAMMESSSVAGGSSAPITNAMFANTSSFSVTGFYILA